MVETRGDGIDCELLTVLSGACEVEAVSCWMMKTNTRELQNCKVATDNRRPCKDDDVHTGSTVSSSGVERWRQQDE